MTDNLRQRMLQLWQEISAKTIAENEGLTMIEFQAACIFAAMIAARNEALDEVATLAEKTGEKLTTHAKADDISGETALHLEGQAEACEKIAGLVRARKE